MMEEYEGPPRPGVSPRHASIEDIDPTEENPAVATNVPATADDKASGGRLGKTGGRFKGIFSRGKREQTEENSAVAIEIPLQPSIADDKASGGRLGKIGGRFKGIFSRGKRDSNVPSKEEIEEERQLTSETFAAKPEGQTELLSSSEREGDEGRFGKMRGRMKNIFSRGKKQDKAHALPSHYEGKSDIEESVPPCTNLSFDTTRDISTGAVAPYAESKPPSDKPTALQSIKAFMRGPPKEEDQHSTWRRSKSKPICRSSNVLNVLLIGLTVAGIIMTVFSHQSQLLRVIGPLCIGLPILALVGKIFFTLYFQEDPFPRLRPLVERASQKMTRNTSKSGVVPPPSAEEVDAGTEMIQMEEMRPAREVKAAEEALSKPSEEGQDSRAPDMYRAVPGEPDLNRPHISTPELPRVPPRSGTPELEALYTSSTKKTGVADVKSRYL